MPSPLAFLLTLDGHEYPWFRDGPQSAIMRQFLMPANRMPSWFGFLRIEADLAMTFIIVARNHLKPENAARSLGNARKALAEIQRGLMKPTARGLSEDQVLFLEQRCTEIKISAAGF